LEKNVKPLKLFEIVRKKAKFSQTSVEIYRNFPKRGVKFVEISRIFSMARMAQMFSPNAREAL